MKFTPRKIRNFLKEGMQVTVQEAVSTSAERESDVFMYPGEVGLVKSIKCSVVCIIPGKERRLYDEFVSVEVIKEIDGQPKKRRASVSYDNIQLLGVLEYVPERVSEILSDMSIEDAIEFRWSGIYETYILIKYTRYDGSRSERRYDLHVK